MDIVSLAQDIATKAHRGAFRKKVDEQKQPKPYIEHPFAVVESLKHRFTDDYLNSTIVKNCGKKPQLLTVPFGYLYEGYPVEVYYAAGWMHDVLEDTDLRAQDLRLNFYQEALKNGVETTETQVSQIWQWNQAIDAVVLLTKNPAKMTYVDYLKQLIKHPVARLVKIADLKDNMKDLGLCSLLEKYQLTLWALENKVL